MTLRTVCPTCGAPHDRDARCPDCQPPATDHRAIEARRGSRDARGYDRAWRALSLRARRAQPFCSDCGATEKLTVDHSPQAWERRSRGLPIRLSDVDVVCSSCNNARGPARGPGAVARPTIADHIAALTRGVDPRQ